MKNLLSLLTEISKWLQTHPKATQAPAMQAGQRQREDLSSSPAWEKLGVLLNTQAQIHAMDAGETHSFSAPIKSENLDMALRELRLAQRSALSQLEQAGVISEDVLSELCTHINANISGGVSSGEYAAGDHHPPENEDE